MLGSLLVYIFLIAFFLGALGLFVLYLLNSRENKHMEEEYKLILDDPEEIFEAEFNRREFRKSTPVKTKPGSNQPQKKNPAQKAEEESTETQKKTLRTLKAAYVAQADLPENRSGNTSAVRIFSNPIPKKLRQNSLALSRGSDLPLERGIVAERLAQNSPLIRKR